MSPLSGVHRTRMSRGEKFISHKISKIMHEGVRGKKVPRKQAVAIAFSMARKKGLKVKRKR